MYKYNIYLLIFRSFSEKHKEKWILGYESNNRRSENTFSLSLVHREPRFLLSFISFRFMLDFRRSMYCLKSRKQKAAERKRKTTKSFSLFQDFSWKIRKSFPFRAVALPGSTIRWKREKRSLWNEKSLDIECALPECIYWQCIKLWIAERMQYALSALEHAVWPSR